jgi:hypothetical protein
MTIELPSINRMPRWAKQSIAAIVLAAFIGNPGVGTRVMSVACSLVHSVKIIKKFDDTIGLRNILQFS